MSRITGLALRQRSVVLLATILVGILGIFAVSRLQMELIPDIDIPVVSVITVYPGADPGSVDAEVSAPIESAVRGISGLNSVQTNSSEGFSVVIAEFEYGTNMADAEREIERSVTSLGLPDGAERPDVQRINFDQFPVIQLSLVAEGDEDLAELRAIAQRSIAPALASADGVSRAEVTGGSDDQVLIALDPALMVEAGVTPEGVAQALQANNLSLPAGAVVTETTTVPVRVSHQVTSLEEIESLIVGSRPATEGEGTEPVTLGEVAEVSISQAGAPGVARTNGDPSIAIDVYMTQGANTVDTAAATRNALDDVIDDLAATGTEIEPVILFDQSEFIEESIDALVREAGFGAIFAVVIIFLFLLSGRATFVTAVSIPSSVLVAFLLLWWQGITLNIMTLGGLAVSVGRVVDDSIVVLESIYRHVQRGSDPRRAAFDGTKEVALAITASTVTTICVFLPLGLIGGLIGEIFLPFALTVTFALLASLAVALTIVPVLASYLISKGKIRPASSAPTRLQRAYLPALRFSLKRPVVTLAIAGVLLIASFGLLPFIGTSFLPASGEKIVAIEMEMPAGTSQDNTLAKAAEIEDIIESTTEVETIQTQVGGEGLQAAFTGATNSRATITAILDSDIDMEETLNDLRANLEAAAGEAQISVAEQSDGFGGGNEINVIVTGESYDAVSEAALALTEQIATVENLANVENDVVSAKPEIIVDVDPTSAAAIGASTGQIANQVRQSLAGTSGGVVVIDGAPYQTSIEVTGAGTSIEALGQLPVGNPPTTPLAEVATLTEGEGPVQVIRIDGDRAATVSGTITVNETGGVTMDVQEIIDNFEAPEGVEVSLGGVAEDQAEAFASMGIALLLAVALVYLAMVVSFGSLATPFVILFTLPLAVIGVLAALAVTGKTLGLPALIGVLMLVGIVVTNAIVLLEYVLDLQRHRGMSVVEALTEGGKVRLRPILMTALATMLALTPLALSGEGGSIIASDLAVVVIGGLFTSTLLTLLVVPALYKIIGGWQERRRDRQPPAALAESAEPVHQAPTVAPAAPGQAG